MSDKTCETCAHGSPCVTCIEDIGHGTVFAADEGSCDKWAERADSAGKIIRDLLDAIDCPQCPRLGDWEKCETGAYCGYEDEIIARANALGIEVPE